MSLVVFDSYTEIGRGLVVKAELESAGFTPSFENFHYATALPHEMLALGGLKLQIPEEQYEDAQAFINAEVIDPPLDYDPIPVRAFKKFAPPMVLVAISSLLIALPFFLCLIFIRAKGLIALTLIINTIIAALFPQHLILSLSISAYFSGLIALLAHAEYYAGPKLLRGHSHVT